MKEIGKDTLKEENACTASVEPLRHGLYFTTEQLDILAWCVRSEIKVQEQLLDHSDGTLLAKLVWLEDILTW